MGCILSIFGMGYGTYKIYGILPSKNGAEYAEIYVLGNNDSTFYADNVMASQLENDAIVNLIYDLQTKKIFKFKIIKPKRYTI